MNDPPASSRTRPAVSIEPVADDTPVEARPPVVVELVPCTEMVVLVSEPDESDVEEVVGVVDESDDGLEEAGVELDGVLSVVDTLLDVGRTDNVVRLIELEVADMSMVVLVEAELVVDSVVDGVPVVLLDSVVEGVLVVSLDSVVEGVLVVLLDSVVEGVLVVLLDSVVEGVLVVSLDSVVDGVLVVSLDSVVDGVLVVLLDSVVEGVLVVLLDSVVLESVVLDCVVLESVLDDGVDSVVVDLLVFVQPQFGSCCGMGATWALALEAGAAVAEAAGSVIAASATASATPAPHFASLRDVLLRCPTMLSPSPVL